MTFPRLHAVLAAALAILTPSLTPAQDGKKLHTDRPTGSRLIKLPKGDDAFGFIVYGDRTGGRPEGLKVLEQAVEDTNLLDPDLVMTVGDLIQGYNETEEWLREAEEFKGIMDGLNMNWFPVAGNHDIYYRGKNRPKFGHEKSYEKHFGPLWYAFEHKKSLFVVLYSDEGNRQSGKKAFNKPELQRMSPEQFGWLEKTLTMGKDMEHIFVFLHHPRWIGGNYGDDWERVHKLLAGAGNVSAVFAGHIHRMRYDGKRDGIEYFALATTGGHLSREIPQAGFLHHFHVVTVRGEKVSVATVPVGTVIDPREITGEISNDIARLDGRLSPRADSIVLTNDGSVDGTVKLRFNNPTQRPIDLTVTPTAGIGGFRFTPDHTHLIVPPGDTGEATFVVERPTAPIETIAAPTVAVTCDYLAKGLRISIPERTMTVPMIPPASIVAAVATNGTARFSGNAALQLPSSAASLPDGPITVEAWVYPTNLDGRIGLAAKTESSEYGVFVSDGIVDFSVHLNGSYRTARSSGTALVTGKWQHVAGVYDERSVKVFVDGKLVGEAPASGKRKRNGLPFYLGADVDRGGRPTSHFRGAIDEFRLSSVARYTAGFAPQRRFETDPGTSVLLHLDRQVGPWYPDHSGKAVHATARGMVVVKPATAPLRAHGQDHERDH